MERLVGGFLGNWGISREQAQDVVAGDAAIGDAQLMILQPRTSPFIAKRTLKKRTGGPKAAEDEQREVGNIFGESARVRARECVWVRMRVA